MVRQISVDGTYASDVLGPMLLAGVGLGLAFVPQTIAAVSGVKENEAGFASGLINTSQQVGGALGLALLSTVAFTQINDAAAAAGGAPSREVLTDGYADAFPIGAGIALVGLVATLALIRGRTAGRTSISATPWPKRRFQKGNRRGRPSSGAYARPPSKKRA